MYDEYEEAREEYLSEALAEEALPYVLENHPDEIKEEVRGWQAEDWVEKSDGWLQLVNVVSQRDRHLFRDAMLHRALMQVFGDKPPEASAVKDLFLFGVASEVSKFLEFAASPFRAYLSQCVVGEDLNWAAHLIDLTRAFRELLFALADPQISLTYDIRWSINTINEALAKGPRSKLAFRPDTNRPVFAREANADEIPLLAMVGEWMCEYLEHYSDRIDLGVCVECGKIFQRQRRDNAYCSKTCQNRVAYKRRKVFDSGLLQPIEVSPKTLAENVREGVWAWHSRFGLGVVDEVIKSGALSPFMVRLWFPQAIRVFRDSELAPRKSDGSKIEFYSVSDPAKLAELL